jgi:hypothetical protein
MSTLCRVLLALLFASLSIVQAEAAEKEYGVYEYVVCNAKGTFDQISADIEAAVLRDGWTLLAKVDAGVPDDCPYKARVFVLYDTAYAKSVMRLNRKTGPFAIIDRLNLFEDEKGFHVSVVNPHSIGRTVLMDNTAYDKIAENHLQALRNVITSAVHGEESHKQYGEMRDAGHIGKTMGVMAGGRFDGKIEDAFVLEKGTPGDVAGKISEGLSRQGKTWGMHLVYRCEVADFETVVLGTTGTPMDSKSFSIVNEGSDDSRSDFKCPGLAHAGAYPLEIVVMKEDSTVRVRMIDSMFRMKMFFEDAGKWAFMKHMGMPGSIEDEIKDQVKSVLPKE